MWKASAFDANQRQLVVDDAFEPVESPDGTRLYYSTIETSVSQIRMIEGGI